MNAFTPDTLSPAERRAGISLAAIFGLRMLGLFLILPVFTLYAPGIPGGDNMTLVGLALGAYGGTQACLQIVWGSASDRFGRKPVIIAGLILFALGSFMAALSPNIYWIIAGRVVQGAGAISAAVSALAADLTREEYRTRIMAMIGASISLVFAGSLVIAPLLFDWIGMDGIFWLTGGLSLAAIVVLVKWVPNPAPPVSGEKVPWSAVLMNPDLARLNFGVFALHAIQTAQWILIPGMLSGIGGLAAGAHWKAYLPAVLFAFAFMVPAIVIAEKKGRIRAVFITAIVLLLVALAGFYRAGGTFWFIMLWLTVFFTAFNILEATQPSLISRIAPQAAKGKALGVYNTLQAVGLFVGGGLGGVLAHYFGNGVIFPACMALTLLWLFLAAFLRVPQRKLAISSESR